MLTAQSQRTRIVSRLQPVLTEFARSKFRRWQDEEQQKTEDDKEMQMRRRVLDPNSGIYVQAEDWMQVGPKKDYEDRTQRDSSHPGFDVIAMFQKFRYWDISLQHQRRKQRYHLLSALQYDQRYPGVFQVKISNRTGIFQFASNCHFDNRKDKRFEKKFSTCKQLCFNHTHRSELRLSFSSINPDLIQV